MRRLPVITLTLVLLAISVSAAATGGSGNVKDKFTQISWSGSDGSLPWAGSWSEINDDGQAKYGNVRVVGSGDCASVNCIRMSVLTTLLGGDIGVGRGADTSDLEDLELSFDVKATGSLLGSELEVEVFDGDGWETVKQYQWGSAFTDHPIIDIGDFSSEEFQVRFLFSGPLLGGEVFIDNVEIRGTVVEEETTTTTTTTVPTTTTTVGTTTTTKAPSTTTTTRSETTTSTSGPDAPDPTTSTTVAGSTIGTGTEDPDRGTGSTTGSTTSTTTSTTTTTIDGAGAGPGPGGDGTAPEGTGIRAAARGLQASFQGDLYGDVRTVSSLAGVDFDADYNMAVEVIEASWAWMVLLGLVVAYSIISGIERRQGRLDS